MSGNPMLDRQIMQAVQPQFDPMQAINQMQRQPMQQIENPVFGGTIPMNFGLPQASQIPAGYVPRLSAFTPSQAPIAPVNQGFNPLQAMFMSNFSNQPVAQSDGLSGSN